MRRIWRHGPPPAMVVACLALGIALAGTSYAAIQLPRNSVGTKQLKKNAVTAIKIKSAAVTGAKIKNDSVTGADVLEASLAKVPSAAAADAATSATNATSAGNADKLDGLDSVNVLPGGTLPAGSTLRGNWIASTVAGGGGDFGYGTITFLYTLGAAPTAHLLVPAAPPTPECRGSVSVPEAASGQLCLYTQGGVNVAARATCNPMTNTCSASQTNVIGTVVRVTATAAGLVYSWGTWAATG